MKLKNLLEKRGVKLEIVPKSSPVLKEIREKDIVTNNSRFTKSLLKRIGSPSFYLVDQASLKTAESIIQKIKAKGSQEIVGLGGGKAIDVAKKVASKLDINLYSIPTSPSHDGLISKNCSLYQSKVRRTIPAVYPQRITIPLDLWKESGDLKKAGASDLISNLTALQDISLAETRGEKFNNLYKNLSFQASHCSTPHNLHKLGSGLILSGLAMEQTSRYCSGSEHEVERLLERKMENKYLHGQLSGTGTLISAKVYSKFFNRFPPLRFNSQNLFKKITHKMKKGNILNFALAPLKNKEFNPDWLKEISSIRPKRYTLWNFIPSKNLNWTQIISEIKKTS